MKEEEKNYEIFKKANNKIKEKMLDNNMIDIDMIINNTQAGTKNELFKDQHHHQ